MPRKMGISDGLYGRQKYFGEFPAAVSDRCIKTVNIRRRSVGKEMKYG